MSELSHNHHYVPEWYQKRFMLPGTQSLCRLDLKPQFVTTPTGYKYLPKAISWNSPSRFFCTKDLYMLRFAGQETDKIEKAFFGAVDLRGKDAVEFFSSLDEFKKGYREAHKQLLNFIGAQRFRTPRGLDWLRAVSKLNRENVLIMMTHMFQAHSTMWMESTWEIVRATNTTTKFIISDTPVTFYNTGVRPESFQYPGREELDMVGTRTLFPMGLDRCLIITHNQYVRNPKVDPKKQRTNARSFAMAVQHFDAVQFGRELGESEVLRINFVMKKAATRYIAAAKEEWLYPERSKPQPGWFVLDDDWFLMPDPWRVPFTKEISWGNGDGTASSLDAYGRRPWEPDYQDPRQRELEWLSSEKAKHEWALKRRGKSHSKTMDQHDSFHDKWTERFLEEWDATHKRRTKH